MKSTTKVMFLICPKKEKCKKFEIWANFYKSALFPEKTATMTSTDANPNRSTQLHQAVKRRESQTTGWFKLVVMR